MNPHHRPRPARAVNNLPIQALIAAYADREGIFDESAAEATAD